MRTIALLYEWFRKFLGTYFPTIFALATTYKRVIKYVISGGTSALVNLLLLFTLTSIAGVWYLYSTVVAFVVSLAVSFALQKLWTFRDPTRDRVHHQAFAYLLLAVVNLFLDTILMYLLVSGYGMHYLLAQIILGLAIACSTYYVNKFFIFKHAVSRESAGSLS